MSTQDDANIFLAEYAELCKKHGLQLSAVPAWRATNHGTYELVIEFVVKTYLINTGVQS